MTTSPLSASGSRATIAGLDGVRAIAVTLVFLSHVPIAAQSSTNATWFRNFPDAGFLGVNIFFVLSGFLITHRLLATTTLGDDGRERIGLRRFAVHRIARLYPALMLFVVVHAIYAVFFDFPPYNRATDELLTATAALFQFSNYAILANIDNLFDNGALWSLAVEAHFYVIWALVFALTLRFRRTQTAQFVSVGTIILLTELSRQRVFSAEGYFDTYLRTDTRISSLFIGVMFALAWTHTSEKSRELLSTVAKMLSLPALVTMVWIFADASQLSSAVWRWQMTLFDLCTGVVVLAIATHLRALVAVLSWRPLAWVGTISYGLYLWQVPVFHILNRHADSWSDTAQGIVAVIATVTIATVSWYVVEKPARRSRLVRRLSSNAIGTPNGI